MARKILLADDSVTAQNMGRRILTDAGYEIVTVNNGSAALKKIAELKPDLIILDVYMPGYGGLEVCQRVKENRETARIPVLLTVGKLEPFKPEEARRARADAYIVKPFEASELLTALTKLEDKIVPQSGPNKPGRFAKAMAAMDSADADSFGDKETGWKERLIIPKPGSQPSEAAPETSQVGAAGSSGRGEDFKPAEIKTEFERPIPAGLPQDITPEEIAAITAAAAAFGGKPQESVGAATGTPAAADVSKLGAAAEPEKPADEPAATFASVTQPEAAAESQQPQPTSTTEPAVETIPPPVESRVEAELQPQAAAEQSAAGQPPHADADVMAALASLGIPVNGDAAGILPGIAAAELAASSLISGPRWMAEQIPVPDGEATFILEQEMEKAYAAFAAADSAQALLAEHSHSTVTAVAEPVVSTPAEPVAAEPSISAVGAELSPVAEAPAVTAEKEPAAYAAAASATSSASVSAPEAISEAAIAARPMEAPLPAEGGSHREAELAAAWANWKPSRESAPEPEAGPQAAQPEAASQEIRQEEASASEPVSEPEAAAASSSDPAVLASMVDDMLAELKPKLMAELSKKLSNEKKKKKH